MSVVTFSLLIPMLFFAGVSLPVGIPPAPEDPYLARIAPEKCLYYTTWSGTAEADPRSANHTERLVAEAEVRHFLRDVEQQIVSGMRTWSREAGDANLQRVIESVPLFGKSTISSSICSMFFSGRSSTNFGFLKPAVVNFCFIFLMSSLVSSE